MDEETAMLKLHELEMAKADAERWFEIVESTDDFHEKKEAFDRASMILRNHGDILQIRFDDPDFNKRYSAVKATVIETNIGVVNANAALVNAYTAREIVSVAKELFDRGLIAEASDIMKGNMVRIAESDTSEVKLRAFDALFPNQEPHLRLSEDQQKELYMEMSKEQLVDHIYHRDGEIQKLTRENVHLTDKCRMLEGRLGTANGVFGEIDGPYEYQKRDGITKKRKHN